jgi:hypothetical protein
MIDLIQHHTSRRFWVGETYFTWEFMCSSGSASRAARNMSKIQAFIATFSNGSYEWLTYFNDAVMNRCKTGMKAPASASILIDPLKYGTPRKVIILSEKETWKI